MGMPRLSDRHLHLLLLFLIISGIAVGALGGFIAAVLMTGGPH